MKDVLLWNIERKVLSTAILLACSNRIGHRPQAPHRVPIDHQRSQKAKRIIAEGLCYLLVVNSRRL